MKLFQERALPDLDNNIKCGNSLIGPDYFDNQLAFDTEEQRRINALNWNAEFPSILDPGNKKTQGRSSKSSGFDAVIGNPPYVDSEWMTNYLPNERQYCANKYASASGNWDIFCVFVEKALELTKPNGYTSFIIPNKLASAAYASETRRILANNNRLLSIRDYTSVPVFPVSVYPIIYVATNSIPKQSSFVKFEKMATEKESGIIVKQRDSLPYKEYFSDPKTGWPISTDLVGVRLVNRIVKGNPPLSEVAKVTGSATVSEAYKLSPLITDKEIGKGFKFVNSGTIDRFSILWGKKNCRYIKKTYRHPRISNADLKNISENRLEQAKSPKIVIAGMTKVLECCLDINGEYLAGKSTTVVIADFDLRYLLGILNSQIASFYYESAFGGNKLAGGYLRIGSPQVATIPIPQLNLKKSKDKKLHDLIASLVDQLIQEHAKLISNKTAHEKTIVERRITSLNEKIDSLVFDAYGLNDKEVELIKAAST